MTPLAASASHAAPQSGVRAQLTSAASGWLHALQVRAQAFSWFPGPLGDGSAVATPAPVARGSGAGQGAGLAATSTGPHGAAPTEALGQSSPAAHRSLDEPVAGVGGPSPRVTTGPSASSANPPTGNGSVPQACVPSSAMRTAPRLAAQSPRALPMLPQDRLRGENPPARVHIEHGTDGPRVWLGVDLSDPAAASHAATLLAAAMAGPRARPLAALVCNGTQIYGAPSPSARQPAPSRPHQEQSWPSAH